MAPLPLLPSRHQRLCHAIRIDNFCQPPLHGELEVTVAVEPAEPLAIPIHGELELVTEFVERQGTDAPFPADDQAYRVGLSEADRMLEVTSRPGDSVLILTPAGEEVEAPDPRPCRPTVW